MQPFHWDPPDIGTEVMAVCVVRRCFGGIVTLLNQHVFEKQIPQLGIFPTPHDHQNPLVRKIIVTLPIRPRRVASEAFEHAVYLGRVWQVPLDLSALIENDRNDVGLWIRSVIHAFSVAES